MDTRTLCGRRRRNVRQFTEQLNSPVQGTGADILKIALALLFERDRPPGAVPVLAVHDEIVVETPAERADAAIDWVRGALVDAVAAVLPRVPAVVEVAVGESWVHP